MQLSIKANHPGRSNSELGLMLCPAMIFGSSRKPGMHPRGTTVLHPPQSKQKIDNFHDRHVTIDAFSVWKFLRKTLAGFHHVHLLRQVQQKSPHKRFCKVTSSACSQCFPVKICTEQMFVFVSTQMRKHVIAQPRNCATT